MTATESVAGDGKEKSGKLPVLIGVLLALIGAGGGYYAVRSGLLPLGESAHVAEGDAPDEAHHDAAPQGTGAAEIAFVAMEPMVISLGPAATARHLRFRGQIETSPQHTAEVERLMPRIVDVLNSYLRAVQETDLEQPAALVRLRAQMLRRVQIVAGPDRVNDLLIMEFVLN
ncbi:flagellar basal body-associated protein FliL [Thalassovita sp.]|uniref:flagellar basal body-associated FliL family protein n=1 Tax=Thalassovita sp. TaxID=1979401 RepID=UPI0029DE78CC|nr:flagellar basal body-associated FliL family protein [Thalassovita sp.]